MKTQEKLAIFVAYVVAFIDKLQRLVDADSENVNARNKLESTKKLHKLHESGLKLLAEHANPETLLTNTKVIDRTRECAALLTGAKAGSVQILRTVARIIAENPMIQHDALVRKVAAQLTYTPATSQARCFNAVSALRHCGVIECSAPDVWTHYTKHEMWKVRETQHAAKMLQKLI